MTEQRAFTASRTTHDDEYVILAHSEVEVAHQYEIAVSHRQIAYLDMRLRFLAIGVAAAAVTVVAPGSLQRPLSQLNSKHVKNDGENPASNYYQYDTGNHGPRRCVTDSRGTFAALEATQASGEGD
jgi:hypothetical protein